MQRLSALPLWAVIGIEVAWWVVLLCAAVLEQPLVASPLSRVMPTAPDWQINVAAVAYLVVYAVLWHSVGHRLAEARQLSLASSSSGTARRINPAFGALGVVLVSVLTVALVGVSVRRALSLAEQAADKARTSTLDTAVTAPTPQALDAAADRAWHAAMWPDLAFTVSLMALLALLGTWHGYRSHARHHAMSLQLLTRLADRAAADANLAGAAAADAERRAVTQAAALTDRAAQAQQFDEALGERFEQAKTTVRHALSYHQGRPEATTTLTTHQPPRPVSGDREASQS